MAKTDAEKYAELSSASIKLLAQIRTVFNSPEYQAVWRLFSVHGFTYRGPDFGQEAAALADVLVQHAAPESTETPPADG